MKISQEFEMARVSPIDISRSNSIDSTFVLFFLAVELGRSSDVFATDTVLLAITTLMLMVLPYFLSTEIYANAFGGWLFGRIVIALFGCFMGFGFERSLDVILPHSLTFLPMTCLIVAATVSCLFQFYGMMKLRLVR
jgi:uncharacterized membrane protein